MTAESDLPPGVMPAEKLRRLAERYARIFGQMSLPENRTHDFPGSGLQQRRIIGFYALLLERGQLNIVLSHSDAAGQEEPRAQPLDVHDGWKPFADNLLAIIREWAELPAPEQTHAREEAERTRLVTSFVIDFPGDGLADVIVANFGDKTWVNKGPSGRYSQ
ncbi:hypothetical protein IPL85_00345 [Candidatus Saccharibacteria bacterium]|nr:MAG: hypothetical protein IPL85_00345 [Candidatus Saccharibacteria bacterium]